MDQSSSYKTKLTDIGNNRLSHYKYNKSKYAGGKGDIKKDEIQDIGGGNFIVEDKKKKHFFKLNVFQGIASAIRVKPVVRVTTKTLLHTISI